MKKVAIPLIGSLGLMGLVCGCYSPNVAYQAYPTTAFSEVAIKQGATLRILSLGAQTPFVARLKQAFADAQGVQVSEGEADYWLMIDALEASRLDTAAQVAFTGKSRKVAVGAAADEAGPAHDELVGVKQVSRTMAKSVSVAVYEAATLTPVHYFEVPVYDGTMQAAGAAPVRPAAEVEGALAAQIVGRVKDIFVTQVKQIEVPVPQEASAAMRDALASKTAPEAVAAAAKTVLPQRFEDFLQEVEAGGYAERADELKVKLCDYHIQALAEEIGCRDAKRLQALHARQSAILRHATTDSLALSCSVALARLEYKLANLGVK